MDISLVLLYLRPGEEWALNGNEYSGLTWYSDTIKPSEDEIIAAWPAAKNARFLELLRRERNNRLEASDWTQMPDAPVDQGSWAEYRQALRDLPANTTDPENPVWPTPPA